LRPGPVDPAITKALIGFTGWFSLYQVIMLFGSRVDVLMTAGLTNEHVLGQYSAAQKISALVVAATNAYYTVLLAEAAATGGGERLRGVIRQGRSAVLLLAAGMGILALLAGPIIAILYGSAFTEAASVLAWMCPGLAFLVLAYPVNAVLYVRNRVAVFPLTAALSLVVSVGANLLLLPAFGARGAAMAYSLTALSALFVPLGYSIAKRSSMLWKEGGGTRP
jgi:O-antigen/teichoic acid export membrane protein